ncbi:hypothetical protein QTH87_00460 [Variovorax sp. J22P168]|uniref:hypothetical protein n=1 Tax=Variovorax jilinensis TaxID=3053513 RepID=UPI002574FE55|nr:hypothetical protein [Variovorax sp. J22P168]MDM0010896.1 hypothetical protein [Variovorax sp. J22P168]
MPTLDDVYRKFGETSEAAQLLETELGNVLLLNHCVEAGLFERPDSEKATEIYRQINKQTLGQLIKKLGLSNTSGLQFQELLSQALKVRNRLAHSFYLRHNLRRNSEAGCAIMIQDLESMHNKLMEAYKAVMLFSGVDLDKLVADSGNTPQPIGHLPI